MYPDHECQCELQYARFNVQCRKIYVAYIERNRRRLDVMLYVKIQHFCFVRPIFETRRNKRVHTAMRGPHKGEISKLYRKSSRSASVDIDSNKLGLHNTAAGTTAPQRIMHPSSAHRASRSAFSFSARLALDLKLMLSARRASDSCRARSSSPRISLPQAIKSRESAEIVDAPSAIYSVLRRTSRQWYLCRPKTVQH